jgi:ParE-like toxin of type II ParDE toxin-antitoxin system
MIQKHLDDISEDDRGSIRSAVVRASMETSFSGRWVVRNGAPEAARDIREIWSYTADDSLRASRRVRLQLLDTCQRLAENPRIGHSREDPVLATNARE